MHARNPAVILLADSIGRTPSAVSLKLVNFASLDPELRNRGVRGMGNVSAADKKVWDKFYGRWEDLADLGIDADSYLPEGCASSNLRASSDLPSGPSEQLREMNSRNHQRFFRSAVLAAYDGRCCITEMACRPLLRASHIVPWSRDPSLRTDPRNGLCLNALHDAAFDRGLISLSDRLEVMVSPGLSREIPEGVYREMFDTFAGKPIAFPERFRPSQEAMTYHRCNIYKQ